MSDRPNWLPEPTPIPSRPTLPLWRQAISLGLMSAAVMIFMGIFALGWMIFSQPTHGPSDTREQYQVFGVASLILGTTATILGAVGYLLRRKPRAHL
jgi:hypothetical protein